MSEACPNCASTVTGARFCSNCGTRLKPEAQSKALNILRESGLFFGVQVLMLCIYAFVIKDSSIWQELLFQAAFTAIVIAFGLNSQTPFRSLYYNFPLRLKPVLILVLCIPAAFLVNKMVTILNVSLMGYDPDILAEYRSMSHPLLISLFMTAVLPPVIEELAMRGVAFHYLLKVARPGSVIIITSALFAIMHFSLLSIHIFFLGLLLGYLRYRYRTLWYPMICHAIFNATIVIQIYYQGSSIFPVSGASI